MSLSRRNRINLVILAAIIPLNVVHVLWYSQQTVLVNPWLARDYPTDVQWYVMWLCEKVSDLLLAVLIYRLSRLNQVLRNASGAYLIIKAVELAMFFWNCNQSHPAYLFLYSLIGVIVLGISLLKSGHRHSQFG
jgi:chromate transport protein ChrA